MGTLALAAIGLAACAAPGDGEEAGSVASEARTGPGPARPGGPGGPPAPHKPHRGGNPGEQHHPGGHFGRPGRQHIDAPQGVFFADIDANGTGCPAGTWDVSISPDGETFTLAFSAYEAQVTTGQAIDVKDCTLDIKLTSPSGLSFAVGSFYYQGYVSLEHPDMLARQTASYAFDDAPPLPEKLNDVSGPIDQSYLFTDNVEMMRRAWSPCGQTSTLHVNTRLEMRNDQTMSGAGYINNSTVDGSLSMKWRLAWRRCEAPPPPPSPPTDPEGNGEPDPPFCAEQMTTMTQRNCNMDMGGCTRAPAQCNLGWCCPRR